jgi:mannitol PTS system EIICBA or EIICB component
MTPPLCSPSRADLRTKVQAAGRFLSAMVMPNIGAFIAWGLITALFIPHGWWPNAQLARLVGPMITWLLPLLIGYTGGHLVHGARGGVIAAIATSGVIVGAEIPMLMASMLVGPGAAWLLRRLDLAVATRVRPGFEMLANNFSLGILGALLAALSCIAIGPLLAVGNRVLASGVNAVIEAKLLPFAHVLIEPGKVLFLNNAINHGVLGPLALTQSAASGRSILFLLETNPGPGLGILLAYWVFGPAAARTATPAAAIIHFFGGIHEIYFPYVLMRPRLILAAIGGGMAATSFYAAFAAGLVAMPSPGSIFAYVMMSPRGGLPVVLVGVALATVVSFSIAAALLKFAGDAAGAAPDLATAQARVQQLKRGPAIAEPAGGIRKIIFACDAGMGSSVMGAAILRRKLQDAGVPVAVAHSAVDDIPFDADLVVTHRTLTARARARLPLAEHLEVDDFLKSPVYDELIERLRTARV